MYFLYVRELEAGKEVIRQLQQAVESTVEHVPPPADPIDTADKDNTITDLRKEVEHLKASLGVATEQVPRFVSPLCTLVANECPVAQTTATSAAAASAEAALAGLRVECGTLASTVTSLESERDELKRKLDSAVTAASDAKRDVDRLTSELASLKTRFDRNKEEVSVIIDC